MIFNIAVIFIGCSISSYFIFTSIKKAIIRRQSVIIEIKKITNISCFPYLCTDKKEEYKVLSYFKNNVFDKKFIVLDFYGIYRVSPRFAFYLINVLSKLYNLDKIKFTNIGKLDKAVLERAIKLRRR